ncbi:sulfotransferase family protein [Stagnihabitans tardus]|uniref:Sulfotransferase n=1 Tax=Stagnihabitans tardus TaxID=2699202 RepID=A0AAE4YDF5_9RHOB|nr:sulfotransferase [Stagnihabitans tardus]NBZ90039.1 hypothetical protein [Stagnihabitans tardus]
MPTDILFVYGALRSGTTMFRLMLDAHPQILHRGERDFLFDHLQPDPGHPTGWRYDREELELDAIYRASGLTLPAEKDGLDLLRDFLRQLKAGADGGIVSLNIHRNVEKLVAILPGAKIIHLVRDPRDVARSSVAMGWDATLYHAVGHWLETEEAWDRVAPGLDPGQVHELRYEDLLLDLPRVLEGVCAFIGCAYESAILTYHATSSYGPPDPGLIDQWKRKSNPREIRDLEARAAEVMLRRGYALSAPVRTPGLMSRLRLGVVNRLGRWRFGIERYGAALYFGEKLTRWLRLEAWHCRIRNRMEVIWRRHLK